MAALLNRRTEEEVGMRFCITCDKMRPLAEFATDKRRFKCVTHYRESRRNTVLGTPERRATNSFRSRARQDMVMFGHTSVKVGVKHIRAVLTQEQMAGFSKYCIIPMSPDMPLSEDNMVVVTTAQRRFAVSMWKAASKSAEAYRTSLAHILNVPLDVK
jgi:hypothetical protein